MSALSLSQPVHPVDVLQRAASGQPVSSRDAATLLTLSDPVDIQALFAAARRVRAQYFGDLVFLYGFLYFSTHCRNNCRFCQYRKSNTALDRYRKSDADILTAAEEMAQTGVHLIDLTMGEDPDIFSRGEEGLKHLADIAGEVGRRTGLPVMVSPGVVPDRGLAMLADAGVTWYACYQETHTRALYDQLRPGQDFDARMAAKKKAARLGMRVEEGLLTGVGETVDDLVGSLETMAGMDAHQVRVMTFVPQAGTPMAGIPVQDDLRERMLIAVMRLMFPDRLIPASLDVDGLDGLQGRLEAGANVITSIVPPEKGLAGVAHNSLDINDARRTLEAIRPILGRCGLETADVKAYRKWVESAGEVSRA